MSKKIKEELIKKYLAAESSLEEEQKLFNNENNAPDLDAWATYVKHNRKKGTNHLKESIWHSIETRKKRRQRYLYAIPAAAASIALLVTFFITKPNEPSITDEEKWALLTEALTMFPEDTTTDEQRNILYEDETIVIYTTEEK
jgi:hypothetical protein